MYNVINKLKFDCAEMFWELRNCVIKLDVTAYEWDTVVTMGIAPVSDKLALSFRHDFFEKDFNSAMRGVRKVYGDKKVNVEKWKQLHNLGYLPIEIRAFSDGANVFDNETIAEVANTVDGYGWLVYFVAELFKTEYYKWCLKATMARDYVYEANKAFKLTTDIDNPEKYIGFVGNPGDEADIEKSICWSVYSDNSNIRMTGEYASRLFAGTGVECSLNDKNTVVLKSNVLGQVLSGLNNASKLYGRKNEKGYIELGDGNEVVIQASLTADDVRELYNVMREKGYAASCVILQINSDNFEYASVSDGTVHCSEYLFFTTDILYGEFNNRAKTGKCRVYIETPDVAELDYEEVSFEDRNNSSNVMGRKLYNETVTSEYGCKFEAIRGLANKLLKNTIKNFN